MFWHWICQFYSVTPELVIFCHNDLYLQIISCIRTLLVWCVIAERVNLDSLVSNLSFYGFLFKCSDSGIFSASLLRYQEELMRLRVQRRNHEGRRMSLMNAGRMIQHRGSTSRSRLSLVMDQKYKQEQVQSGELEKVRWILTVMAFPGFSGNISVLLLQDTLY